MPHFERVHLKYDGRASILGINQAEPAQIVETFGQNAHVSYPLLLDEDGLLNREYTVSNLPTTIFVDADGIIREVFVGTMNQAVLENKLNGLMEQ